jgi:hypothetical protein
MTAQLAREFAQEHQAIKSAETLTQTPALTGHLSTNVASARLAQAQETADSYSKQ